MTQKLEGAACGALPPRKADRLFFGPGRALEAVRLCMGCPVRVGCALDALEAEAGDPAQYRYGVYGALLPAERARLDRQAQP